MSHSDPDVLAMLALGDPDVDEADAEHVMGCPECSAELARLTRVTRAARENGPLDFELKEPSPAVWEGIRAQLTLEPLAPPAATSLSHGADAVPPRRGGNLRRRLPILLSAAAVFVIAVLVTTVVLLRPADRVEAQATLAGLPAWSTSVGQATMERESNGTTVLAVELQSPAVDAGGTDFREVWLMSSDLTKAISVGLLSGESGRFVMPPSVAAADYPVVDVSQQPLNGDPGHSGDSIVRGTLTPATR
ncbi:anti-sigma factor [Leifsonia sp. RAF41]|uniref:anti-sigma factor n=1 Tax=Leifsonia sp. RAF41 TaxID=3233056 RepID=UPI003F9B42B9